MSTLNDGNQNNRECINEKADLEENRNFVAQLKELFDEYQHQIKAMQKELIRASEYNDMQREVRLNTFHFHVFQWFPNSLRR